jgi:hypothetical protein
MVKEIFNNHRIIVVTDLMTTESIMMMTITISHHVFVVLIVRVGILDISTVSTGIRSGGAAAGVDLRHSVVGVTLSVAAGVMASVGTVDST